MGDAALLVETTDIDAVLALDAAVARHADQRRGVWLDVTERVPAARTLLLLTRPGTDLAALARAVMAAAADAGRIATEADLHTVEVPVRYDGPDLVEVARLTGLSPAGVVAAHTGSPWRVGFGGFAPGFAYLVGGDARLRVPRRSEPRTRVPAGSVGLAGAYSGVYPRESPGGWQLIGSTDVVLFDVDRDPPALLCTGTTVRFVEIGR
jgi:KipI family sensor histidine kinase inhibitor